MMRTFCIAGLILGAAVSTARAQPCGTDADCGTGLRCGQYRRTGAQVCGRVVPADPPEPASFLRARRTVRAGWGVASAGTALLIGGGTMLLSTVCFYACERNTALMSASFITMSLGGAGFMAGALSIAVGAHLAGQRLRRAGYHVSRGLGIAGIALFWFPPLGMILSSLQMGANLRAVRAGPTDTW